MPVVIKGAMYYRTTEAARKAGLSRSTLLRWLEDGVIKDACRRDRRGWRLFSEADIEALEREASRMK